MPITTPTPNVAATLAEQQAQAATATALAKWPVVFGDEAAFEFDNLELRAPGNP